MFTRIGCWFLPSQINPVHDAQPISGPDFREHRISDCVIFLQEGLFKKCISIRASQAILVAMCVQKKNPRQA
jgi:hypothetical protein